MGISHKQLQILAFPFTKYDCLICDGAIRSGKTSFMTVSFIDDAMRRFNHQRFGICGKTVDSTVKNIISPYLSMTLPRDKYRIQWRRTDKLLVVSDGNHENYFEVFGGRDERSYTLIQGRTLAGVLLDEVALQPRSFVDQALARCSVAGSRLWFNCNPESPNHWFYKEWICQPETKNALHLHFSLEDNPALDEKIIERYKAMYSGVFYDRYIRGLWVMAEGLIYPQYNNTVPTVEREYTRYYISMDYGTLNPTAMLLWGYCDGVWYAIKEYYHSGRETQSQKTDNEYREALEELAGDLPIRNVIIDPSAASFITLVHKTHKFKVLPAKNAVLDGIRDTATALQQGKIMFNDCCVRTIEEFGLYRWDDKAPDDKPIKDNDHAMDAVRYFVKTIGVLRGEKRKIPTLL